MKFEEKNGILIITPEIKQIDVNNSPKFSADLVGRINDGSRIILDLRNVVFMDSTGLGIIVEALRGANEKKGKMVLCGPAPAVKILFEMVRLSQITSIFKDLDEALETFSN